MISVSPDYSLDGPFPVGKRSLPLTHGYPRVPRAVGLVAHSVERIRLNGLIVCHVPIEGNDYHGETSGNPSRGKRRKLAADCEIIVPLDGDEAERLKSEQLALAAQRQAFRG